MSADLKFDEAALKDYVTPVLREMNGGNYVTARAALNSVPSDIREQVRLTIAAKTSILL